MRATHQEMRALLDADDLAGLFNVLGWDRPPEGSTVVPVPETDLEAELVALKLGVGVWQVETTDITPRATQRRVASELSRYTAERLVVFVEAGEQLWLWPEQSASGVGYRLVDHRYVHGHGNDGLLQRLADAAFTLSEERSLTVLKVLERVRRSFNVDKVTKAFYKEFKKHHDRLTQQIEGIEDFDERRWYVSVLLNRLMFVYFVQRKRFLDDDPQYLRTRLGLVRDHYSGDDPRAFFGKFLLPLFHQALGSSAPVYQDPTIARIVGSVPYVNGGIFEIHPLEATNSIAIKDAALEEVLDFLDSYRWHLDERPSGEAKEINPDVLGYIFEQYINQKQQGAYYTKTDVTGYMADVTILAVLVDRLLEAGAEDPLVLLSVDADRYLPESLRHGVDHCAPEGVRLGDRAAESHGLPGECWAEALDRHNYYKSLRDRLADDSVRTVDEAVTANVALRPLLVDYLRMGDARDTQRAYEVLRSLSICDPTCGSGAFLFAALDLLEELYQAVFDRGEELCAQEPQDIKVLRFLSRTARSPSRRYSLLKTICLNNLYGVDLMPEAAEIARLRLFLKLAAQIDDPVRLEPLPDLDFNVKSGNLLVGMALTSRSRPEMHLVSATMPSLRVSSRRLRAAHGLQLMCTPNSWTPRSPMRSPIMLRD